VVCHGAERLPAVDRTLAPLAHARPIRRFSPGCCARAAIGHATAAPPRSVMNSRRIMKQLSFCGDLTHRRAGSDLQDARKRQADGDEGTDQHTDRGQSALRGEAGFAHSRHSLAGIPLKDQPVSSPSPFQLASTWPWPRSAIHNRFEMRRLSRFAGGEQRPANYHSIMQLPNSETM
jgi:hypothetical protein